MSCVILIRFCRLIEREKKGWPPKLFDAFSRNRPGLSANRRSSHGGRSRPRRCSLDQPFTSQDCRGTSAARLSRECHRCVSAFGTPSLGELERIAATLPMQPGRVERREFEYERHGTLTLIANFHVVTGQLVAATLGPTRTE